MNTNNLLELVFQEILGVINPLSEDCTLRLQIIDQLQTIVSTVESLRGATVEPFGSFLSHLFARSGDLDISIELSNTVHIQSPGKKHKQSLLVDVVKALKKAAGFHNLQLISNAKVPIVTFKSQQNISCDISISNLSGQMKSKFLFWISAIDPRFREMVLLVKEWAKAHKINNPKAGSLNSYSLCLLIIFHFQTCEPAIFPPLKELYPENMAGELKGVRSEVEQHFEEVCAANIRKFKNSRRINMSSLPKLFLSFLLKFCDMSVWAEDKGICTFSGMLEDIGTNMGWLPKTYALLIEDPLEQPHNCGRGVSSRQLIRIEEAFRGSYEVLTSPNQTRRSVIQCMAPPQVCWVLDPRYMEAYHPNTRYRPQHEGWLRDPAAAAAAVARASDSGLGVRKVEPSPPPPRPSPSPSPTSYRPHNEGWLRKPAAGAARESDSGPVVRKAQPLPPPLPRPGPTAQGGKGKDKDNNMHKGQTAKNQKRASQAQAQAQAQAHAQAQAQAQNQVWRPKNVT